MWIQTRAFDVNKAGTTKYLCLANVRKGYSINAKYPDATAAWNNTQQHRDRNFPACAVPVFYSWVGTLDGVRKDYGHIAVRLPDGRVWTDGRYYANVDELSAKYLSGSSYLGWGESVNDVRVVENVIIPSKGNEDMIKDGDGNLLAELNYKLKGWPAGSANPVNELNAWRGRDWRQFLTEGLAERNNGYNQSLATKDAFYNKYSKAVAELEARPTKAQLDELMTKLGAEANKVAKAEAKALEEAQKAKELGERLAEEQAKEKGSSEDTKLLDSIKDLISKLVARFK